VVCLAPRVREDSVHPRLQSGACARPLNFTVRLHSMTRHRYIRRWEFTGSRRRIIIVVIKPDDGY
jgi:hypothetical protein